MLEHNINNVKPFTVSLSGDNGDKLVSVILKMGQGHPKCPNCCEASLSMHSGFTNTITVVVTVTVVFAHNLNFVTIV